MWVLELGGLKELERLDMRILGNAVGMEERCEVIERLGGVYYADEEAYPGKDW
jgi:hypothetical protein